MQARPGGGSAAPPSWPVFAAVLLLHGAVFAALTLPHGRAREAPPAAQVTTVRLLAAQQETHAPPPAMHPPPQLANPQIPKATAPLVLIAAPRTPAASPTTALRSNPARPADHSRILQRYAAALWARIAAHRRAGLHRSGTALIAFGLDPRGKLLWVKLRRSSGDAALDAAALVCVRAAAPFPAPPGGLTQADLVFTIPFEFS